MKKLFSVNTCKNNNSKNEESDPIESEEPLLPDCIFPFVNLTLKDSVAKQHAYRDLYAGFI